MRDQKRLRWLGLLVFIISYMVAPSVKGASMMMMTVGGGGEEEKDNNYNNDDNNNNNNNINNNNNNIEIAGQESEQVQAITRLQQRLSAAINKKKEPTQFDVSTTTDTDEGCLCNDNGKSGDAHVPYVGCAKHLKGFPSFCFVSSPNHCLDFSKESQEFPGGRWRLCTPQPVAMAAALALAQQQQQPDGSGNGEDPNTEVHRTIENGISKYSMQHQGVSTTLVTEGDHPLEGEAGKNRTKEIIEDVKQEHENVRSNVTAAFNETKHAVDEAYGAVNDAMFGAMEAIDVALKDAFKDAKDDSDGKPTNDKALYDKLYNKIHSRIMANTGHLQAKQKHEDDDGGDVLEKGTKETLYDRMLKMSDNIRDRMDAKMKRVADKLAAKAAAAAESDEGPVSVKTTSASS